MSDFAPAVIFDLGNVILPFDPLRPCTILGKRCGLEAEEVARRIYSNNLERWFEQGIVDGDRFTAGVSRVLGIEFEGDEWQELWAAMFTENAEVSNLVRELKPNHPLLLLSNTNPWHWAYAREHYPVLGSFDHFVLSYEVGVLKPHPNIYRAALEKIERGRPAIFIDDMELNVAGARVLGIQGIKFESAGQLRRDLKALGCRLG